MARIRLAATCAVLALAVAGVAAEGPRRLSHRVWLLSGVPDEGTLTALRAEGVGAFVLPVGRVEIGAGSSRFTLAQLPDLSPLAGWPVAYLVWVEGSGKASGDPDSFVTQLTPVQRSVAGADDIVLASREYFPGLPEFAVKVAARLQRPVELALPAQDLMQHMPPGGWPRVRPVAVAFGNPSALGFPAATLHDDLLALDVLDGTPVPYRVAIVVAPSAEPSPGPGGGSLALLSSGETAAFTPGERGSVFRLRKAVSWGGVPLAVGQSVTVEMVDTAMYHRDLGLLLRPVRPLLEGWDTVGLPNPEPTLGMSRAAFLEYLRGESPYPRPRVDTSWTGPTAVRLTLTNPTAQASALATTGNWVELRFEGTEVRDVQLGEFGGMEYGRIGPDGGWHLTVARDASAIRLFLTFVPPQARVAGALVTFLSRPHDVNARWHVRLGDGTDAGGPLEPVPLSPR
ncbi:MAG TPA: hypothetical protein VMT19_03715 [Thermoanaerobaculaceae bacterium]|nr:hypothetical protein [Thermoanaerobaculaceae bacterium]